MNRLKPFSLPWWLNVHKIFAFRAMKQHMEGNTNECIKAMRKLDWIYKRIVNKFHKPLDIDQDNRYLINNKQLTGK